MSCLLISCVAVPLVQCQPVAKSTHAGWIDLPQLPEALGGQCVGTSGEWLLVAGGSSWTAAPWSGGVKQWSDRVYGLRKGDAQWTFLGRLPSAGGYFAAATWKNGLLCVGGEDASHVFSSVLWLRVDSYGRLIIRELPALPHPLTLARAAVLDNTLFVAGGLGRSGKHISDGSAVFLSLKLDKPAQWTSLANPWKRTLEIPEVAASQGKLLIAGGAESDGSTSSKPIYVTNVWEYAPSTRHWKALPPLPHPVTGGAAICSRSRRWIVLGGDDGSLAAQMTVLRENHPGFTKDIFAFDQRRGVWNNIGSVPVSLLGTPGTVWNGMLVLPGGEDRPAHRSSRVLAIPFTAFP